MRGPMTCVCQRETVVLVQVETITRVNDVYTQCVRTKREKDTIHRRLLTILRPAIADEAVARFIFKDGKCPISQLNGACVTRQSDCQLASYHTTNH